MSKSLLQQGILPDQLLTMPIPQLMALGGEGESDSESAERAHLRRLVKKGVIGEDEVEARYQEMQVAKAERSAGRQSKKR